MKGENLSFLDVHFDRLLLVLLVIIFALLAWHGYHYNETGLADFAQSNIKLMIGALLLSMRAGTPQDRQPQLPPVVNVHLPSGALFPVPVRTVENASNLSQPTQNP